MTAKLTKAIYFNDETVELNIDVDNSQGGRTIDDIEVAFRQIIDVKTGDNFYKHGSDKYGENTRVYDLAKLRLGVLSQCQQSHQYQAKFNIVEVVENLFKLRQTLRQKKIVEDEETGKKIEDALVRNQSSRQNKQLDKILTDQFQHQFLNNNMQRKFVQRPSIKYLDFSDMDPMKDCNLST